MSGWRRRIRLLLKHPLKSFRIDAKIMNNAHYFSRVLGVILLAAGLWLGYEAVSFIRSSQKVEGRVIGYSSVQKLDRAEGECSAYSKSCAVKVEYTLGNGTSHTALLSQPIFGRSKVTAIGLLVDPAFPEEPRIASLNVLFRNPLFLSVLGLTIFGLSFAIAIKPQKSSGLSSPQPTA